MTPLNIITSNILAIKRFVAQLCSKHESINTGTNFKMLKDIQLNEMFLKDFSDDSRKLLQCISNVEASSKSMFYYNSN